MALDEKAVALLEERWRLLTDLRKTERVRLASFGREMAGYEDFYDTAHKLLTDNRWPAAFQIAEADRKRYGNTPVGDLVHPGAQRARAGCRHALHPHLPSRMGPSRPHLGSLGARQSLQALRASSIRRSPA